MIALISAPLRADVVHLKGGGQISGVIVEQTQTSVKVDIGGGTLEAQMANIVRIEKGSSPLQEYRDRAAGIAANDAEAWRALARFAEARALATQALEAWSQVVAILPDDPDANRALGHVELNGAWVSEEESYRARGFVEFENEWMTPDERQAILANRAAQAESDRQAADALIEAQLQASAEREAQKQAERDAFWADNLPVMGDPVLWGEGWVGPASWPAPVQQPIGRTP